MLVLTRREGEAVVLRDRQTNEVVATVTIVRGGHAVRLGFEADDRIQFIREEVLDEFKEDGK